MVSFKFTSMTKSFIYSLRNTISFFHFIAIAAAASFLLVPKAFADQTSLFKADTTVKYIESCSRAPFDSYENWLQVISRGSLNRADRNNIPEAKKGAFVEANLSRFKVSFPESLYNKFKAEMLCNTFEYEVEGEMVIGYVMQSKGARNSPVLIYNRGGNGNFGAVIFATLMNTIYPMADRGFTVIGTQYRGTFKRGTEHSDQFGGDDVKDVVALNKIIQQLHNVDTSKIGMFGTSRGAMQTLLALQEMDNINAAAILAGNYNLEKGLSYRPEMEEVFKKRIPNYEENKSFELKKRSAVNWVDKLPKIPLLILHGSADKRVSVKHARELEPILDAQNHPYKMIIFGGDNHSLSNNRSEVWVELADWFNKHL